MSAKIFDFEQEKAKRIEQQPVPLDGYQVEELELEEALLLIDTIIDAIEQHPDRNN